MTDEPTADNDAIESMTDESPADNDAIGSVTDEPTADNDANQRKLVIVGGLLLLLLVLGGLYLAWASGRVSNDLADREARAQAVIDEFEANQAAAAAAAEPTAMPAVEQEDLPLSPAPKPGEVLVINRVPGDDYGRLAIRHLDGSRTLLERSCVRSHLAGNRGVCLSQNDGLLPTYKTTFFDAANPAVEIKSYASALPSRARISPDGSLSSITAFVTGSSYADISTDSTTIVTIDEIDRRSRLRGASQFTVDAEEAKYGNIDAQYWGMTFADQDEFYITGFYGDTPEIMHGSLESMTVTPTGWAGSCPSLSPDGKTLVFKEMRPEGGFDLVAVDVASTNKWVLGETRSADDQVEWLDNDTILYALHPDGGDQPAQPEFDIWMIDIAEGSEPELFLPNADSPAVAR